MITLNGTTGITTPDIDSTAGFDGEDLTGDVAAARITNALSTSSLAAGNLTGDVAAARITGALNATGSAPIYACRAWVNFNGTSTVAIRASGNVSSITDNGTGDFTVNFTTALSDVNYAAVGSVRDANTNDTLRFGVILGRSDDIKTTAACQICTFDTSNGALTDLPEINLIFVR